MENSIEIVDQIGKAAEEVGIGCRLAVAGGRFEPEDSEQLVLALRELLKNAEMLMSIAHSDGPMLKCTCGYHGPIESPDSPCPQCGLLDADHDGDTQPAFVVRPVPMDDVIREHLRNTLVQYQWNISRAALALEVDRRTVYRMMKRYRLPSGK